MSVIEKSRNELLAITCKRWGIPISLSIALADKLVKGKKVGQIPITIYEIEFRDAGHREFFKRLYKERVEEYYDSFSKLIAERRELFRQHYQDERSKKK